MGGLGSTITDRLQAEIGLEHVSGDPRVINVFEPTGYDKTLATETTLYFADVAFTTEPSDTPANEPMSRLLSSSTQVSASLLGPEVIEGEHRGLPGLRNFAPQEEHVIVRLVNTDVDPDTGVGSLDKYADGDLWSFAGRNAFRKIGAEDLAYTAFQKITGGAYTIQGEPLWTAEGDLLFILSPPLKGFGQPFQPHTYGGFGLELQFDGSTTYVDYGNEWDVGKQDTCIEWQLTIPDGSTLRKIQQKRASLTGAGDAGLAMWIAPDNTVKLDAGDGTNRAGLNFGSADDYTDGVRRMFSVSFNWATLEAEGFVSEYVAGVETTTSIGTMDITGWGAVNNSLDNIGGAGASGGSPSFDGTLGEFRVWRKARTRAQIKAEAFTTCSGSENSLVACYKFDDRTSGGTTAWQNVVVPALVSLEYSGGTHKIDYGNVLNQISTDDFTFGIWFKTDAVVNEDSLIGNRANVGATNAGYGLSLLDASGAVSGLFRIDDGTTRVSATSPLSVYGYGGWHFVFGRVDRTAETMDVGVLLNRDAQLSVSSTTDTTGISSLSNANSLLVGQFTGGTGVFAGRTGHHFFKQQALSNAQILSLARFMWDLDTISMPGNGLDLVNTDSSFWNQDEGTGTSVGDSWGTRTGTITGAAWTTQDATLNGTLAWVPSYDGDAGLGERSAEQNIQGLRVPHVWGRASGVRGVLVDNGDDGISTAEPFYQFADPLHAGTKAIENGYAGGLALVGGGTDYNAPDFTNNVVQLTAPQDEVITFDVKGYVDGSGDLIDRAGSIASELFTLVGETTQNAASFTALDTDYPYVVSLVTDTAEHLTEEVINSHLRPSCWATKNIAGEIVVGAFKNLDGETADFALTTSNVREDGVTPVARFAPASKVELGFHRNWTPLTSFLGGVQTPDQIRQTAHYRTAVAPVSGIKTSHEDAQPINPTSHIQYSRDAKIEAERLAAIFNRPLMILDVRLASDLYMAEIGDTVSLTYPRFGLSAGKNFMCIGYTMSADNPSLLLWGPFTPA